MQGQKENFVKKTLISLALASLVAGCTQAQPALESRSVEQVTNNVSTTQVPSRPAPVTVHVVDDRGPQPTTSKVEVKVTPATTTTHTVVSKAKESPSLEVAKGEQEPKTSDPEAATFTWTGSQITKTMDGKGRSMDVMGDSNILTFQGSAGNLSISGNNNQVSVENAKSINVTGTGNRISWSGKEPLVSKSGADNEVVAAQ